MSAEPNCPKCGQRYPDGWTAAWKQKRAETFRKSLGLRAEPYKPHEGYVPVDRAQALEMRQRGLTGGQIALRLKCRVSAVYYALRKREA